MHVLVTGATGHIGTNLLPALKAAGHTVRTLQRGTTGTPRAVPEVQVFTGDICDPASLVGVCDGVDAVVHMAGKISIFGDPDGSVHATNVLGTRHVLAAAEAAGVSRVVHVSSVDAYDLTVRPTRPDGLLDETAPPAGPHHPVYDRTKALAEVEVQAAVARGLPVVIVNPSGVVGPNDPFPSPMGGVVQELARGELPALVDGAFDVVDVRDVCDGIVAALTRGEVGQAYFLAGHHHSLAELAAFVAEVTDVPPPARVVPMWLARAVAPLSELAIRWFGAPPKLTRDALHALSGGPLSHDKAAAALGFSARPARASMHDAVASFRAEGKL